MHLRKLGFKGLLGERAFLLTPIALLEIFYEIVEEDIGHDE